MRLHVKCHSLLVDVVRHSPTGPWTTRSLAAAAGCHESTVQHLHSGRRDSVSAETADRLAAALGVPTVLIFAATPEEH